MRKLLSLALFTLIVSACSSSYVILPQFTDVESILHLQKGMSIATVNDTLKAKPFDVITSSAEGNLVVQYQYRHPYRIFLYKKDQDLLGKAAQASGYKINMEVSQLFVSFNNGRLTSYISSNGLKNGERILLTGNNLSIINVENLSSLKQTSNNDIMVLDENNELTKLPLDNGSFTSVELAPQTPLNNLLPEAPIVESEKSKKKNK